MLTKQIDLSKISEQNLSKIWAKSEQESVDEIQVIEQK